MFQTGVERVVGPGTAIVREGVRPNAIFLVIHGQFSVRLENVAAEPLATLRAGELIGEISFLEGSPASATIVSEAESAVLAIDNQLLNQRIRDDAPFAARIYRSFALTAERRLRNRVNQLASLGASSRIEEHFDHLLMTLACHGAVRANQPLGLSQMRALLVDLDQVDFGGHCPHGRPVVHRLTLAEVERLFKRG